MTLNTDDAVLTINHLTTVLIHGAKRRISKNQNEIKLFLSSQNPKRGTSILMNLYPSSGGIGRRLKIASAMLIWIKRIQKESIKSGVLIKRIGHSTPVISP